MILTKEKTIQLHRELWSWMAKTGSHRKDQWPGWKEHGIDPHDITMCCPCCEYALQQGGGLGTGCKKCPLDLKCVKRGSAYNLWTGSFDDDFNSTPETTLLAQKIADMPESKIIKEAA